MLSECARCALDVAHDLGSYIARARDDYSELDSLPLLLNNLKIFPALASNSGFIDYL